MICFVVGPSGVGKTCFAQNINELYGIPIYDTGPILRHVYKNLQIEESFGKWISDNERKYGNDFAISVITKEIKSRIDTNFLSIIVGNRCIEGIRYLINSLELSEYRLIYLDACYDCLKRNYEQRENKTFSNKEFQEIIDGGNRMGLIALKQFALENSNNRCFYYYKEKNEDLIYDKIFKEIFDTKISDNKKEVVNYE